MSTLTTANVQVGRNATASQNFTLRTNADGTLRISRGELGALLGDVLTVNADGTVTGNIGLGAGQTWQDLTASRTLGTNYTNTTGRPITVSVAVLLPNTAVATLVVGGVIMARGSAAISNYTDLTVQLFAVVPPGQTYSLQNSGAAPTIRIFSELR